MGVNERGNDNMGGQYGLVNVSVSFGLEHPLGSGRWIVVRCYQSFYRTVFVMCKLVKCKVTVSSRS